MYCDWFVHWQVQRVQTVMFVYVYVCVYVCTCACVRACVCVCVHTPPTSFIDTPQYVTD